MRHLRGDLVALRIHDARERLPDSALVIVDRKGQLLLILPWGNLVILIEECQGGRRLEGDPALHEVEHLPDGDRVLHAVVVAVDETERQDVFRPDRSSRAPHRDPLRDGEFRAAVGGGDGECLLQHAAVIRGKVDVTHLLEGEGEVLDDRAGEPFPQRERKMEADLDRTLADGGGGIAGTLLDPKARVDELLHVQAGHHLVFHEGGDEMLRLIVRVQAVELDCLD